MKFYSVNYQIRKILNVKLRINILVITFLFEVLNFTMQISNEELAVALYKLSSKERDVILLHYFQNMSDQEIAELYHVSRSAVYRRRSNGLKKLKVLLKKRN